MHMKKSAKRTRAKSMPMPAPLPLGASYRSRAGTRRAKRMPIPMPLGASYRSRAGTRRNTNYQNIKSNSKSQQKIILTFLEMLDTIKVHHWKTMQFSTHKATDDMHDKLSDNVDKFVETMIGKNGIRVNLTSFRTIPLCDYDNDEKFKNKIDTYKTFLIGLNKDQFNITNNSDLLNIRDELLGNLNQLTYLLTFK